MPPARRYIVAVNSFHNIIDPARTANNAIHLARAQLDTKHGFSALDLP